MSLESSPPPIPSDRSSPEQPLPQNDNSKPQNDNPAPQNDNPTSATLPTLSRSNRPSRACTIRTAARLYAAAQSANEQRKSKGLKKERRQQQQQNQQRGGDESPLNQQQCSNSKIVTSLVAPPPPAQLPRWSLRSMWELASVLNFLHVSSHKALIFDVKVFNFILFFPLVWGVYACRLWSVFA